MTLPLPEAELEALIAEVVARTLGQGPTPGRTVAIGSDHRGLALKAALKEWLAGNGYQVLDVGAHTEEPVDYPDIAAAVARAVAEGRAWRGVVIDGAGIGSCIAANKVPGVRAALCYNLATAANAREHNDANVLSLGSGMIGPALAEQILKVFLETPFAGGRHARRVEKIALLERQAGGGSTPSG